MVAAREAERLEPFPHFARQSQQHGLSRQIEPLHEVETRHLAHVGADPAADQEMRLGGKARDLEPGRLRPARGGAEVHPRAYVLQPKPRERVVVKAVPVMAQHRAHAPLGSVVLAARQTVVDREHHAARHRAGEPREPRAEPQVQLGGKAVAAARYLPRVRCRGRRSRAPRPHGSRTTRADRAARSRPARSPRHRESRSARRASHRAPRSRA